MEEKELAPPIWLVQNS